MANIPVKNATINEIIIGKIEILTEICPVASSKISIKSDNKIIGILIKNENFATCFLFLLHKSPALIVEPEREIPGKTANPCAIPIKNAVLKFNSSFLFCFENASETKSKTAESAKQTGRKLPPNELFIIGIKTSTIKQVGIVATTSIIVSLEKGCVIIFQISL